MGVVVFRVGTAMALPSPLRGWRKEVLLICETGDGLRRPVPDPPYSPFTSTVTSLRMGR